MLHVSHVMHGLPLPLTDLEYETLEDGDSRSKGSMEGKDDIVQLHWVHSSRVLLVILVLKNKRSS